MNCTMLREFFESEIADAREKDHWELFAIFAAQFKQALQSGLRAEGDLRKLLEAFVCAGRTCCSHCT